VLTVRVDGTDRTRFYTPSIDANDLSFEQAAHGLRRRVEAAVEKRLMSDVPLGAFLSGGIDSSIVVGTMAGLSDDPVKTFTVGFEESLFDESWAAREVAEHHGTDHTEYTVTAEAVRDAIPAVLDELGEPFADQSLVPTYVVARETSRDVTVALSGDGADELFAGYDRYRGEYYSRHYRLLPRVARTRLIEPAVAALDSSRADRRGEAVRKLKKFVRGGVTDVADRHLEWARISDDGADRAFPGLAPADVGREVLRREHECADSLLPARHRDDMSRILAVDTRFGLPNQILQKTDLASMYNSLEVRVPFLDTAVVEYALSLPTSYKITPRRQKRVLKRAFDDVLPPSILDRGKQGFDMPIGEWFKHELATEFTETVRSLDTGLVDSEEVLGLFHDHRSGAEERGKFLWSVYVFAQWYTRMERAGVI
jgi:asparagine synthase (glutamine-hydrolysing)